MKNIKLFFALLIVHCTLLIGEATAQWWVQGGNLFWPYGNVSVTNGNMNVSKDLIVDGTTTLNNDLNLGMNLTISDTIKFNNYTKLYGTERWVGFMGIDPTFSGSSIQLESMQVDGLRRFSLSNSLQYYEESYSLESPVFIVDAWGITYANEFSNLDLTGRSIASTNVETNKQQWIKFGEGSPEGVEYADRGCLFIRSDGGVNSTLYVKETDNSNTGWSAK